MSLVTKLAPDFRANAVMPDNTIEPFQLSSLRGRYIVLFFYPMDFTFVCPTELIAFDNAIRKFEELNTQLVSVSVDSEYSHFAWKQTERSKGGVGKPTTCGMIIDYLCRQKKGPILVVDADANSNLNEVLGVEADVTLGQIREEMAHAEQTGSIPAGMTKADYAEMQFNNALIEEDDFDMLVMGRTQGKGCYCYVNGVLKTQVDKYAKNYAYVVMDNEAGLEHVARGTLPKVDTMLLSFPTAPAGEFRRSRASRRWSRT